MFARILLRIFASMSNQWYWPVLFFFCGIFFWFWYYGFHPLYINTMDYVLGSGLIPSALESQLYHKLHLWIYTSCSVFSLFNKHLSSNHTKPSTVWCFLDSVQKDEHHYHSWFTNEATRYTEKVNFSSKRVQTQWEPEIRPRLFDPRVHACYHYSADQAKLWQMILLLHSNVHTC